MRKQKEKKEQKKEGKEQSDPKDWEPYQIKVAIKRAGTCLAKLSRENGLASQTLNNVFYRRYPKGEKIIADRLGVLPQTIWPSRYMNEHNVSDQQRHCIYKPKNVFANGQAYAEFFEKIAIIDLLHLLHTRLKSNGMFGSACIEIKLGSHVVLIDQEGHIKVKGSALFEKQLSL